MKGEINCSWFVLLAILLTTVLTAGRIRKPAAKKYEEQDNNIYTAFDSASWAITSRDLSPLLGKGKQSLYDNYITACDDAVQETKGSHNTCTRGEKQRLEMNTAQPSSVSNYTQNGYAKVRVPPDLYTAIKSFFDEHRDQTRIEWKEYNVYHNAWEAPPTFIDLQKDMGLTNRIEETVKPILEEWTGQKLKPVSTYGIRLYHENSILAPHVDRMPLVTSVISKFSFRRNHLDCLLHSVLHPIND